jgi:dTMP kinase
MQPPTSAPGRLITVTGIDGAGKSTLAAALHRTLTAAGQHAVLVGKHTVDGPPDPQLSRYLDAVNSVVYRARPDDGHACGDRYWLFALAAWYTLQDELVVKPALAAGATVLLDNTPHKILARYTAGATVPPALAQAVFADLSPQGDAQSRLCWSGGVCVS